MNKNLDFMRALAVSLVVFQHTNAMFMNTNTLGYIDIAEIGKTGVLIFFVHTCTVLMQSLERDSKPVTFYMRRMFRIYPLAVVCIVLVMLTGLPMARIESTHHLMGWHADTQDKLANLFLMQEMSDRMPVLGVTWSLTYEIAMYVFLPFIFVFAHNKKKAIGLYAAALALSVIAKHVEFVQLNTFTRNFMHYLPAFVPGVIAWQLLKTAKPKLPSWTWPLALAALCLLHVCTNHSDWSRYIFTLSLGFSIPYFKQLKSARFNFVTEQISKYSYGIYLTHYAAIYWAFDVNHHSMPVKIATFVCLLVGMPIMAYHLVEEPMMNLGKYIVSRDKREKKIAVIGLTLAVNS